MNIIHISNTNSKNTEVLQTIPVNMCGQKLFVNSAAPDIVRELGENTEMQPIIYD